jgi:hypothetical protein
MWCKTEGEGYKGELKDDQLSGKGVEKYQSGDVYEGEGMQYGNHFERHGQGKMTWADGSVYEGSWDGDMMHRGRLVDDKGKTRNGEWKGVDVAAVEGADGEFLWFDGYPYSFKPLFVAKSGAKGLYTGPLKEGKPEGKGKVVFDSGSTYEGSFHNGWRHGKGVLRFAVGDKVDRDRYEGDFKEDMRSGKGILYWKNGHKVEAEFKNGDILKDKMVTYSFPNRVSLLSFWDNGIHGKVVRVNPDGKKNYEYWEHGKKIKDLSVLEFMFKK